MFEHKIIIGNVYALIENDFGVYVEVGADAMKINQQELENKCFSVGFKIIDSLYNKEKKINYIKEINLMEVSIVSNPAQEGTDARFK